jgi:hypothetical protein
VILVSDPDEVNAYLAAGWKLIDKHVTAADAGDRRHEVLRFVLAWQSEDPPPQRGFVAELARSFEMTPDLDDDL